MIQPAMPLLRMIRVPRLINRPTARAATITETSRTHMSLSHGSVDEKDDDPQPTMGSAGGPRPKLSLGLNAARASQNLIRLLEEYSTAALYCRDTLKSVWHEQGLVWRRNQNTWTATRFDDEQHLNGSAAPHSTMTPSLLFWTFSDDRTALVKLQGSDGLCRYLSVLRLDDDNDNDTRATKAAANAVTSPHYPPQRRPAHDGWQILREVMESTKKYQSSSSQSPLLHAESSSSGSNITAISKCLQEYFQVEHGGGMESHDRAVKLFAPNASLLAVGSTAVTDYDTSLLDDGWSAPVGSLLHIPVQPVYLSGVQNQTPHEKASSMYDAVVTLDVLPCQTAACAVVQVGNGAQTTLFVDHLLLGKQQPQQPDDGDYDDKQRNSSTDWIILSKTFSPRPWPQE